LYELAEIGQKSPEIGQKSRKGFCALGLGLELGLELTEIRLNRFLAKHPSRQVHYSRSAKIRGFCFTNSTPLITMHVSTTNQQKIV